MDNHLYDSILQSLARLEVKMDDIQKFNSQTASDITGISTRLGFLEKADSKEAINSLEKRVMMLEARLDKITGSWSFWGGRALDIAAKLVIGALLAWLGFKNI